MKDIYHIHPALPKDIHQLVALENECFSSDRISRRSFRNFLNTRTAKILIAQQQTKILGCAVILFRKNSKNARIYSLVVHPNYRHRGIAAKLNQASEEIARKQNCTKLILEVRSDNRAAISFYQKHNYVLFGTYPNFYEDQTDALRMVKTLCDNN